MIIIASSFEVIAIFTHRQSSTSPIKQYQWVRCRWIC